MSLGRALLAFPSRQPATGSCNDLRMGPLTDRRYLRDSPYRETANLVARSNLHERYGRGDWFRWIASQAPWPDHGLVLEVGCGTGRLWADAADIVPDSSRVVLCDLSPTMVRESLAVADGATGGSVAALPQLPFPDDSFDLVIVSMVMQHLDVPEPAIAELARVTAPRGALVIGAAGEQHLDEIMVLRRRFGDDDATIGGAFGAGGLDAATERVARSFSRVDWQRYEDQLVVDDREAIVDYLRSWSPLDDADDDTLQRLRAEVDRQFDAEFGVMTITKDVGCIVARSPS